MLTNAFYTQLSRMIKIYPSELQTFSIAIGQGNSAWDNNPPIISRRVADLSHELLRKQVVDEAVIYLTEQGEASEEPTNLVQMDVVFLPGEGNGSIRECGLFMNMEGSCALLSYFINPRVEKMDAMALTKRIRLNLSPGRIARDVLTTRYLGNSRSTELHDIENERPGCQLDEIRIDRRYYFNSTHDAEVLGYDFCAYCFGVERSAR